jgi:hypothetical protein
LLIGQLDRPYGDTATLVDTATLALTASAPHTVIDVVLEGIFQASGRH